MSLIDFFSRGASQDWDKAYEVFDFLRKTDKIPHKNMTIAYTTIMACAGRVENYIAALHIFREMKDDNDCMRNAKTYAIVIDCAEKYARARARPARAPPRAAAATPALTAAPLPARPRGIGFDMAYKYYDQMLRYFEARVRASNGHAGANYFVDEVIYSIMLNSSVRHNRLDVAMEIYSRCGSAARAFSPRGPHAKKRPTDARPPRRAAA